MRTPTAVAGVRGTDFVVETDNALQTDVGVFDGAVAVEGLDESGSVAGRFPRIGYPRGIKPGSGDLCGLPVFLRLRNIC